MNCRIVWKTKAAQNAKETNERIPHSRLLKGLHSVIWLVRFPLPISPMLLNLPVWEYQIRYLFISLPTLCH